VYLCESLAPFYRLNLNLDCAAGKVSTKKEPLDAIAAEIIVCPKCRLSRTRKHAVPGEGSPDSEVMFIGEGPGRTEDLEGRPFVGQAGKFLNELLSEAGLLREKVFICNIVRCRPPQNRDPKPDEVQACAPYLDRQLRAIRPRFIVTLGNHSTAYIFSKTSLSFRNITKVHGKCREVTLLNQKATVFPTFHPAAALYSAKYKELLEQDFALLKHKLEGQGS
jgi:DNA polymerase